MNDFFSKLCPAIPWEFKSNSTVCLPGEKSQNTLPLTFWCISSFSVDNFTLCLSLVFSFQVIKWLISNKEAAKPSQQVRRKPPNAPICLLTCCLRAYCEKILHPHMGKRGMTASREWTFFSRFLFTLADYHKLFLFPRASRKARKSNTSRPLILLW